MPRNSKATYKAVAEYYDPEYAHLDYLQQDVPFVLEHLGRKKKRVLELAVGTGRAAIPLAQAGHRVLGIDYDPDILKIAQRKCDFVGLTEKQLDLRTGDMRTFEVSEKFDAVLLLFNTFLTLTTTVAQLEVLRRCHRHLGRGGKLFLDLFNPNLPLIAESHSFGLDPITFHVPTLDLPLGRTVSRTADLEDVNTPDRQTRLVTFHYRWFQNGIERNKKVAFEMTWIFPRELTLLLETAGFTVDLLAGDYDGSPVSTDSPRLIAIARAN